MLCGLLKFYLDHELKEIEATYEDGMDDRISYYGDASHLYEDDLRNLTVDKLAAIEEKKAQFEHVTGWNNCPAEYRCLTKEDCFLEFSIEDEDELEEEEQEDVLEEQEETDCLENQGIDIDDWLEQAEKEWEARGGNNV